MGRKNVLSLGLGEPEPPAPANGHGHALPETPARPLRETSEAIRRGPVGAMGNDLMQVLSNSQREIDPALIDDDSPADRLTIEDEDLAALREQIRAKGQIVPILVREHPDHPSRFRIVYGRRRLAVLKELGIKAKALIRNLDDTEAVIAQGQENNARRDPSFIEKALFAAQLKADGYDTAVILDALVTDKTTVSKMKSVTDVVPVELIRIIGAAPGVGRHRWLELAEALEKIEAKARLRTCFPKGPEAGATSDERFMSALAAASRVGRGQRSAPARDSRQVRHPDGSVLATLKGGPGAVEIRLSRKTHPDFAAWVAQNGDEILGRLHDQWAKERGST